MEVGLCTHYLLNVVVRKVNCLPFKIFHLSICRSCALNGRKMHLSCICLRSFRGKKELAKELKPGNHWYPMKSVRLLLLSRGDL